MRNLLLLCLVFCCGTYVNAEDDTSCHPTCRWQCDDPKCPAICDTVCGETECLQTTCDDPDCHCSSFGTLETLNCSPLANDCPLCEVGRSGIDCLNGQGQACSCAVRCQTRECNLVCHKPACPKPQCELVCEQPPCLDALKQFDNYKATDFGAKIP